MESRLFRLRYISTNDPTPTVKEIEFPDKIKKLFNKNLHDAIIGKISFDREANTLLVRIDYYENHFCITIALDDVNDRFVCHKPFICNTQMNGM